MKNIAQFLRQCDGVANGDADGLNLDARILIENKLYIATMALAVKRRHETLLENKTPVRPVSKSK